MGQRYLNMTPMILANNNLSVLPFYSSIEQQNARKWWVYGRIYPLFTPAMFMLPFQVMRPHRLEQILLTQTEIEVFIDNHNKWNDTYPGHIAEISQYRGKDIALTGEGYITYAFVKSVGEDGDDVDFATGYTAYVIAQDSVTVSVPQDANYLYIWQADIDANVITEQRLTRFEIFNKDGVSVNDYTSQIQSQINIKTIGDIDVIVYTGNLPFVPAFFNGQYYAVMSDSVDTWYSEIFTVVNDIEPYLKIEWWDTEDFIMDGGVIVYQEPAYKNILYLDSDIAKPQYIFEDEGEQRDGYFFPTKQISEKRYRFKFFASEYLLDVMRFIRMADFARITYQGQTYNLDTFLITPEWEDNGDVASVEAEFDTATVAKKIGRIYVEPTGGDFNEDFNDDFKNT